MSRAVKTASTRKRLLEAAVDALERGGEASVRVDSVAEAAGVTRPSVYHFFGDRESLIVAAQIERYRQSLLFEMDEQFELARQCASRSDFIAMVRARMLRIGGADGAERRRVRMDVLGSAASRPALRTLVGAADTEAAAAVAGLLSIAHERGWLTIPYDLEVASLWWFWMMDGRYLVEGASSSIVRREWDAIAAEATIRILFGEPVNP
ncbi:unannotated protein [freshwater metagenome]|uniref:Unannotated protein n=1 Tax=freshwater metagenome TaxID=449393 RepID=A0A6J7EHB6_9ZZZZ